ncbi:MAG: thioredoxin domain-containing protein [Polyangiaceae bacterium]
MVAVRLPRNRSDRKSPTASASLAWTLAFLATWLLLVACAGEAGVAPAGTAPIAANAVVDAGSPPFPSETDVVVPVSVDDATWGDRRAYVTIVVFTDLECPFCARHDQTLARFERELGPTSLRIVTKHNPLPFHPHARFAAEVAEGVRVVGGNQAFARFVTTAFANQRAMDDAMFERWAGDAGVDGAAIVRRAKAKEFSRRVDEDVALAKRLGALGTPVSFVNGRRVDGAVPYEDVKAVVDVELVTAKLKAGDGTPRENLYATLAPSRFEESKRAARKDEDEDEAPAVPWRVPVGKSPIAGPADAPVTIVVFSDFECPFCKKADVTLEDLRSSYGSKLRVVWKDEPLPFHARAIPAALFGRFVRRTKGDAAFFEARRRLFESSPALAEADLRRIAGELGVDGTKALAAVTAGEGQLAIDEDLDLAESLGATGTPQFFVNGMRITGAQPREVFTKAIDAELAKVAELVRSGTKPADVYDMLQKSARSFEAPSEDVVVAVPKDAPSRGPKDAAVTIQVFSDFQCPFCAAVEPSLTALSKNFPKDVRVVWRDKPLPMHPDAPLAAEAARLVFRMKGEGAFWKMHDRLFAEQKGKGLGREALVDYAKELGVDAVKFGAALDVHDAKAAVDADLAAAVTADVKGTPTLIVGRRKIVGAQPLPTLERAVRRALAESKPRRK